MATCPQCRVQYADDMQTCPSDGANLLPDAACANFDEELKAGDVVGEYRIDVKIGEGGFGTVYSATHPVIGKRAAIKVLNLEYSSNPNVVSRFVSEARAVNQIRHKNIIDIFSFGGLADGRQYLIMELLDGFTMDVYLEQHQRMMPEQALPVLRQLARALDAAHAAGIAHRDLKPENIFLSFDDEGQCGAKLLDFGIAKLMGDLSASHKTRTGAAMGTPLYMSPEQCEGRGIDHRTDIYSFGVMIHEVLTGMLPFDGDSLMQLMLKHAQEPPPPMSTVAPHLPAALDPPVLQMLAKDPSERPQSLTAAIDALADAARGAGFTIAMKRTTGGGPPSLLRQSQSGPADSLVEASTQIDTTGGAAAQSPTLNTVEAGVAEPAGGPNPLVIAAAALVVGVGVTLYLTMGSGETTASDGTSPAASVSSAASVTSEATVAASQAAPPPNTVASTSPSASTAPEVPASASSPVPKSPPTVKWPQPPVAASPPPTQPQPPPPKPDNLPDDLASPFD